MNSTLTNVNLTKHSSYSGSQIGKRDSCKRKMLVSFCYISYTQRIYQKTNIDNHFPKETFKCRIFVFFFTSDVQRRIELIQDFEMPTVATSIKVSRDGQYILAAGNRIGFVYMPRPFVVLMMTTYYVWLLSNKTYTETCR